MAAPEYLYQGLTQRHQSNFKEWGGGGARNHVLKLYAEQAHRFYLAGMLI